MRRINDWPVSVRLAVGFGTVSLLMVAVALSGYRSASRQGDAARSLGKGAAMATASQQVKFRSADVNNAQMDYVYDIVTGTRGATADTSAGRRVFLRSVALMHREITAAKAAALDPDDRGKLIQAGKAFDAYMSTDARMIALYRLATPAAMSKASRLLQSTEGQNYVTFVGHVDALVGGVTGDIATRVAEASSTRRSAQHTILLATLFGLLAAAALTWFITRSVTRPLTVLRARLGSLREHDLTSLRNGISQMARGDLTFAVAHTTEPIADTRKDEIGAAQETVNSVIDDVTVCGRDLGTSRDALSAMLGEVSATVTAVATSSGQVAATSQEARRTSGEIAQAISDVAHGSERQVGAVAAARDAAQEVTAAATRSAESAERSATAAARASELALTGTKAVESAIDAMAGVRESASTTNAMIGDLGERSAKIGGIVDTITGIAQQTNLLALNAAIEAARAGDQGRGFAVVADEVRKLAEESQQAAAAIATLIGEIQAHTGLAVDAVSESVARTQDTTATVEETRRTFEEILGAVGEVTSLVGEISDSVAAVGQTSQHMDDQMTEIAQIAEQSSAGSEQVSASTQQTSASSQEMASSAEELAASATRLQSLVGRFLLAT